MSMRMNRRRLLRAAIGGVAALGSTQVNLKPGHAQSPSSRSLADRLGIGFGQLVVTVDRFAQYHKQILALERTYFNFGSLWTPWWSFEPIRGGRNYGGSWLDDQLKDAHAASWDRLFAYALIGPGLLPSWASSLSSCADGIAAMVDFIKATLTYYSGRFYAWNICCESEARGDPLARIIGPDYVEIAFETARTIDPSLKLCYTDYANHTRSGSRYEHTHNVVARLKARGLIDLVGVEFIAWASNPPLYDDMLSALRSYELPVIITEFTVLMHGTPGDQSPRFAKQAEVYRTMLEAALESGVCKDIIVSSLVDKLSFWQGAVNQPEDILPPLYINNNPALFGDDFLPKPSYYAVADVLQTAVQQKFRYRGRLPMVAKDQ